jgi:8-oxo-dGTP pyrophosphatase MutT (NUDIX family)
MRTAEIVTSFLEFGGKILILKRSDKVSTYRGLWAAVSGSIESGENPLESAAREIEEETGFRRNEFLLAKEGESFSFIDNELKIRWVIHPFLFTTKTGKVRIDFEHREFRWIRPAELSNYQTVPKLDESLLRVLGK